MIYFLSIYLYTENKEKTKECRDDDSVGRRGRSLSKLISGRNSHSLVRLRKLKPQSLSGNSPLFVSRGVTGEYGDGVPGGGRPVTHPHL